MLRSAASKVMWLGRATVFLVGLAVTLALVFGVVSTVSAHTGEKGFFHLGHKNVSGAVSKLVGKVAGPSLQIGNASEDPKATALQLNVKAGKPPMKVNATAGKATNLNADKLDDKEASDFYAAGSKVEDSSHADQANNAASAANADRLDDKDSSQFANATHPHSGADITSGAVAEARIDTTVTRDGEVMNIAKSNDGVGSGLDADQLDGLNSTTFGITTLHNKQQIATCDTPPTDPKSGTPSLKQACAPLRVEVPPGKRYLVSVWSSFTVYDSSSSNSWQWLRYCSAMKAPGQTEPSCITPFGISNLVRVSQSEGSISASSSGETHALTEGTYIFGTVVLSELDLTNVNDPYTNVITKIMVRDASAPQPTGVSIP